jgi:hypothetical protein
VYWEPDQLSTSLFPPRRTLMMGRTVRSALELVTEPAELVTTTR